LAVFPEKSAAGRYCGYKETTMPKKLNLSDKFQDHKDILFDVLAAAGLKSFEVPFDGGGDSGQIEGVDLEDKFLNMEIEGEFSDGQTWDEKTKKVVDKIIKKIKVEKLVENICYDALEIASPGWEINEGSYGTFVFDVKKREVRLDLNVRIVELENHGYKF